MAASFAGLIRKDPGKGDGEYREKAIARIAELGKQGRLSGPGERITPQLADNAWKPRERLVIPAGHGRLSPVKPERRGACMPAVRLTLAAIYRESPAEELPRQRRITSVNFLLLPAIATGMSIQ